MIAPERSIAHDHAIDFRQRIIVGDWYGDGWCTPYIRGNFDFLTGAYLITAQIWIPELEQLAGNLITLRLGLDQVASTGVLASGQQQGISARISFPTPTPAAALSLRSRLEWTPPVPDKRILGFVLLDMKIELAE